MHHRLSQPSANSLSKVSAIAINNKHPVHSPEHMSANSQQAFNSQRALLTASRLLPIANRLAEAANRLQTKSQQASNKPIQRQNHHTNTFFHLPCRSCAKMAKGSRMVTFSLFACAYATGVNKSAASIKPMFSVALQTTCCCPGLYCSTSVHIFNTVQHVSCIWKWSNTCPTLNCMVLDTLVYKTTSPLLTLHPLSSLASRLVVAWLMSSPKMSDSHWRHLLEALQGCVRWTPSVNQPGCCKTETSCATTCSSKLLS